MAPARRLSGLQKQVLSLYRQCLRAMRQQPTPEARAAGHAYVTAEFRKQVRQGRRARGRRSQCVQERQLVLARASLPRCNVYALVCQ